MDLLYKSTDDGNFGVSWVDLFTLNSVMHIFYNPTRLGNQILADKNHLVSIKREDAWD